jgi:hypothetical protein
LFCLENREELDNETLDEALDIVRIPIRSGPDNSFGESRNPDTIGPILTSREGVLWQKGANTTVQNSDASVILAPLSVMTLVST